MPAGTNATATCCLTLEPTFRRGSTVPSGFSIGKLTKKPPTSGRLPYIKLRITMPLAAFAPLAPEVTIEVPEGAMRFPEPEVTVEMDG